MPSKTVKKKSNSEGFMSRILKKAKPKAKKVAKAAKKSTVAKSTRQKAAAKKTKAPKAKGKGKSQTLNTKAKKAKKVVKAKATKAVKATKVRGKKVEVVAKTKAVKGKKLEKLSKKEQAKLAKQKANESEEIEVQEDAATSEQLYPNLLMDDIESLEDAEDQVCREAACETDATTANYCRLHYIKNWKKIKRKELILKERRLNSYIEDLVSKYPDRYLEAIRQDLSSEKDFAKVVTDLEIDDSVDDFEVESDSSTEGLITNLKRGFDDDSDSF